MDEILFLFFNNIRRKIIQDELKIIGVPITNIEGEVLDSLSILINTIQVLKDMLNKYMDREVRNLVISIVGLEHYKEFMEVFLDYKIN